MRGMIFAFIFVLMIGTATALSLEREPVVISELGVKEAYDGTVFNKINDTFLVVDNGLLTFNIESNVKQSYIGDVKITNEWGYVNVIGSGTETLTSNKKLVQYGAYVCIDEYTTTGKGTLAQKDFYPFCVYYKPKEKIVTLKNNTNVTISQRNITKITDYKYIINFEGDYDPLTTNFTVGLRACWSFDDNALEEVDGVHNGMVTGATQTDSYKAVGEGSYSFDGNDYIIVNDSSDLDADGNFTVNGWFNVSSSNSGWRGYMSKYSWNSHTGWWNLGEGDDEFRIRSGDGTTNQFVASQENTNIWVMVTAVKNGTDWKVYTNGAYEGGMTKASVDTTWNLVFGCRNGNSGSGVSDCFVGGIDEVTIWNVPLSGENISSLYNGGAGTGCDAIISSGESSGASNYCSCEPGADVYINFTAGCHYNNTCSIDGYDFIGWGSGSATINASFTGDNIQISSDQHLKVGSNATIVLNG